MVVLLKCNAFSDEMMGNGIDIKLQYSKQGMIIFN